MVRDAPVAEPVPGTVQLLQRRVTCFLAAQGLEHLGLLSLYLHMRIARSLAVANMYRFVISSSIFPQSPTS
jgi:hypothetical protein